MSFKSKPQAGARDLGPSFQSADSLISTFVTQSAETTMGIQLTLDGELDPQRLRAALEKVLRQYPVLGCQLQGRHWPKFRPCDRSAHPILLLATSTEEYARLKARALDIWRGPALEVVYLNTDMSKRLLIKVAHEATDGGGVLATADALARAYRTGSLGEEDGLKDRTLRSVWRGLTWSSRWLLFRRYWEEKSLLTRPKRSYSYPPEGLDSSSGGKPELVTLRLRASKLDSMRRFASERGASLTDLMLAVLLHAIRDRSAPIADCAHRIMFTVDLRRYLDRAEQARVANLSGIECLNLGLCLGKKFADTLRKVVQNTQRKKRDLLGLVAVYEWILHRFLPFGLQKRLHAAFYDKLVRVDGNSPLTFTNMGALSEGMFDFGVPLRGLELSPPTVKAPFWTVNSYSFRGELFLVCHIDDASRTPTAKRLLHDVESRLDHVLGLASSAPVLPAEVEAKTGHWASIA